MAEDLRQNPAVQAELDAIAYLESSRGRNLRPSDPTEMSFGTYHLNVLGLVDAAQNGVKVPDKVNEIVGDWQNKSASDRVQTQSELFKWMQKNLEDTDRVAQDYYIQVVRPRAGNAGVPAIMEWQAPGGTRKDYKDLGLDPKDINGNPKATDRFLQHIENGSNLDRSHRAKSLRELLPLLDYGKTVEPAKPGGPVTPRPVEQFDPRIPYPTTEVTDPWMQHGHAVAYQESIAEYGDVLGDKTLRAATQLRTSLDQDSAARQLLGKAYGVEALQDTVDPHDLTLEFAVAPYGIGKAVTEVVKSQLDGDLSFTDRLMHGAIALPFVIGGVLGRKANAQARAGLRGMSEEASPEKVAAAKETFAGQLETQKGVSEGIQTRFQTAEAAGDEEAMKVAKRELSASRRKEKFLETVLDNDKGQAEIDRLKAWQSSLREEGAPLKQIQEIDKRIASAEKRLQDAQDALRLPSAKALQESLETYQNLVKSAKVPEEQMRVASENLIREGKVSLETIMARDMDAAVDPITLQAELRVIQDLNKTVTGLRDAYVASDGGIIEANALMNAVNTAAVVLGKHRRSEIRAGQSVQVLAGKGHELRTLEGTVEGINPTTLPAFAQIWKTAESDMARMSQIRGLAQPGVFKGSILQVLTNGLISSPATAFWNVMSMGAMTLSRMNELRLLGKLDPTHFAADEASTFGQALVGYYGRLIAGDVKARAAWSQKFQEASLRGSNVDPGLHTKYNFRSTISAKGLGVTGAWGRAVDHIGYAINLPTQISAWADAMVSVGVKDAFTKVLAHRQAYLELDAERRLGAQMTQKQINTRLAAREQEILSNPNSMIMIDGKATRIADLAAEEGAVIAMMGKLQSQSLAGVEKWANQSILARMAIPFPHPFLQTAEMALERTPIGRLLPHMKADLAAGGARAAAARAKLATGNQTAALFASFAGLSYAMGDGDPDSSDWVGFTGSGPFNQAQKGLWAATHRADTLRIGGKEFALSRLGPVGQVMSATADAMGVVNELINTGDQNNTDKALNIAAHVASMWTSLVTSELFAAEVKDIAAGFVLGDPAAIERVIERKATMLVPGSALLRDIAHILGETNKVLQNEIGPLKAVTSLNFWGDPTRYYGTQNPLMTLVGFTERNAPDFQRKNRVANKLISDDVAITAPSKTLTFDDVTLDLSYEQQMAMRKYFAQAHLPLPSGKSGTLLQGLEEMVGNRIYEKLVDGSGEEASYYSRFHVGSKQDYINMYVSARKDAAKRWLLGESQWKQELQSRLVNTKRAREFDLNNPQGTSQPREQSATGTMTSPFFLGGAR